MCAVCAYVYTCKHKSGIAQLYFMKFYGHKSGNLNISNIKQQNSPGLNHLFIFHQSYTKGTGNFTMNCCAHNKFVCLISWVSFLVQLSTMMGPARGVDTTCMRSGYWTGRNIIISYNYTALVTDKSHYNKDSIIWNINMKYKVVILQYCICPPKYSLETPHSLPIGWDWWWVLCDYDGARGPSQYKDVVLPV